MTKLPVTKRIGWLKQRLPKILLALKRITLCVHDTCLSRIELPTQAELVAWTVAPNLSRLRNHILAHFHGSTESTVKRNLSSL